ncbi:hypothetical protein BJF93_15220 [Xaviernesmea oryzae]|uniref:Polysaccharide biosynthesis protein n=1 Tax=Xaviernesmea oryzae TaxID=464029 RepID=A0A1Q9AXZ2_9HYPH|nr:oligosaccharide flippase family protein [Xaviernesmea oryzae]OLP60307.1 hypothetical protein BJF93_15220 [Xaviernesmea oryzae]SEK24019.1 Membrane protein involved in the export of O-antigen and teichoic acid [Xaviernesmea oryzae]
MSLISSTWSRLVRRGNMRHLIMTLGGQIGLTALNLATGIVTARMLGPDGRGVYAAVTLWPMLIATFGVAGTGNALIYASSQESNSRRAVAIQTALIVLAQTAIVSLIASALIPLTMQHYERSALLLSFLMIPLAFSNAAHMLFKNLFVARGDFSSFNFATILPQILFLPALCLFLYVAPTARNAILSLFSASLLGTILILPLVRKTWPPKDSKLGPKIGKLFSFSLRAAPADLSAGLAGFADKLVLVPLVSAEALGIYTVTFSFSRLIMIPSALLSTLMYSRMLGGDHQHAKAIHDLVFRAGVVLMAVTLLFLLLVDRLALTIVYGPAFGAAVIVFRILALEAAISLLSQITSQLFVAVGRPGLTSALQGLYTLGYVLGIAVFAPIYGLTGAAAVLAACSLLRCAALLMLIPRVLSMPVGRLYPTPGDIKRLLGGLR